MTSNNNQLFFETPDFEYLLLISPSEKIWQEIMKIKNRFNYRYNHIQAIKSKPHITLINFGSIAEKENDLIRGIDKAVKLHQPFDVTLNGINHFKNHTIFIDIVNKAPIIGLVKALHGTLNLPAKHSFFAWRPHITIAKGLESAKFQEAMTELSGMSYIDSFLVDKIVLMKRKERFDRYKIVKEFRMLTSFYGFSLN